MRRMPALALFELSIQHVQRLGHWLRAFLRVSNGISSGPGCYRARPSRCLDAVHKLSCPPLGRTAKAANSDLGKLRRCTAQQRGFDALQVISEKRGRVGTQYGLDPGRSIQVQPEQCAESCAPAAVNEAHMVGTCN